MPALRPRLSPLVFSIPFALMFAPLVGCDDDPVADVGAPDGDLDGPPPDDGALPDAPTPDAAAPDAAPPKPCEWPRDCPDGDCIDGLCVTFTPTSCFMGAECPPGEVCGGAGAWGWDCALPCELDRTCAVRPRSCAREADCPPRTNCNAGRCINDCVTDLDCAPGHCMDGECQPFPEVFIGAEPVPLGRPGQLYAGVGVAPIDFPIGVSMAGYGGRAGPQTPYNVTLGGSDRVFDVQDGRALVLTTDEDLLIVLRLPLGWSTDYLRSLVARKLQKMTESAEFPNGINYMSRIVTVATHSHSGPGRFWNLLPETGLGVFGHGTFSREMVERYATAFAQAIKLALDDLQPARFGYTIVDDFDPERHIHSDRRGESPPFLDDRLMVWRVEDLSGRPMMGAVNFALHGTHMQETWLTGDVAGGIETIASQRLSAEAGAFAPVMFLNGNAGNVSPRGDASTDVSWGKVQTLGHLVWPIFRAAWEAAEMRADIDLEVVNRRIPIDYDLLGYDATVPDFRDPLGKPFTYGGFSCVPEGREAGEPDYMDGALGCRLDLESFVGHPSVQVHKTSLTAFRIDDLVVTTLPGEPTSELGMLLAEGVEADAAAAGRAGVRALNFGYSQDHQLYLVTPEDWFRGGYEASQNWFGWNLGIYIAGEARSLARELFTPTREEASDAIKPTWWPNLRDDTVAPTDTPEPIGAITTPPPGRVARGALVEMWWNGGHPGVDLPWVVLEQQNERGGFEPLYRSPGVIFDDKGFESLKIYSGNYREVHAWTIRWEFPFDFPLGTYRLRVVGEARRGGVTVPYDAASAGFELVPAALAVHRRTVVDRRVTVDFTLPDGPTNDNGRNAFDGLVPRGHLLRVDPAWRLDGLAKRWSFILGPPLDDRRVMVTVAGGGAPVEVEAEPVSVDRGLVTARSGDGTEVVTVIPAWPAHRVEVALPGPGRYTVFIDDGHGNRATVAVAAEENR